MANGITNGEKSTDNNNVTLGPLKCTFNLDEEQHKQLLDIMRDRKIKVKATMFRTLLIEAHKLIEDKELKKKELELKERELNQNAA